jgi:hypothetical protein
MILLSPSLTIPGFLPRLLGELDSVNAMNSAKRNRCKQETVMNTRALKVLAVSPGLCAAAGNFGAAVTVINLHSVNGPPSDGHPADNETIKPSTNQ